MKQNLEQFVYEVIKMNFKKLGEEIINPIYWSEATPEKQREAYDDAWSIICNVHSSLFNLMNTIDCFRELKEFKKEEESK